MIVLMRIDDRLLHGQIAFSWKAALNYDAIVIANDDAAENELRKKTFKLARPEGVNLATRSVEDAARLVADERLKPMKVFLICGSPKDAYRLYQLIEERPALNIGGIQKGEGTQMIAPSVWFDQEDFGYADKILEMGIEVEIREVPDKAKKLYRDLRRKE